MEKKRRQQIEPLLRQHWPEVPLRAACEAVVKSLVRAELTPQGWVVSEEMDPHPWEVYAVAAELAQDIAESAALGLDAEFMRARTMLNRRGTGGRPPTVSDAQIAAEWDTYRRTHDGRGHIGHVAARLGVDAKTLSARLRKLGLRN